MQLKTCFKNIKRSENLLLKIKTETKKLDHYFDGRVQVQWVCQKKEGQFLTVITVRGPSFEYSGKSREGNSFKAISLAMAKVIKQIKKKKNKIEHRIQRKNLVTPKHTQILELEKIEKRENDLLEDETIVAA